MRALPDRDPQIRKRGNIEDEATLEAFELFDFTTTAGGRRTIQVERARSRDAQHVYRQLLSSNAALPLGEFDAIAAVKQAIESPAPDVLRYAKRLGWRPGGGGFALSDGCIGSAKTQR